MSHPGLISGPAKFPTPAPLQEISWNLEARTLAYKVPPGVSARSFLAECQACRAIKGVSGRACFSSVPITPFQKCSQSPLFSLLPPFPKLWPTVAFSPTRGAASGIMDGRRITRLRARPPSSVLGQPSKSFSMSSPPHADLGFSVTLSRMLRTPLFLATTMVRLLYSLSVDGF